MMEGKSLMKQGDLILQSSSAADSELSCFETTSHTHEDEEGESDSSPDMAGQASSYPSKSPPAVSIDKPNSSSNSDKNKKSSNRRTPRGLRKKGAQHTTKGCASPKRSGGGGGLLRFRSMGTKESIDRSTCSTVVGSTHGDTTITTTRRVGRQGSDLSALSHCTEVDESNPPAAGAALAPAATISTKGSFATDDCAASAEQAIHDYEALAAGTTTLSSELGSGHGGNANDFSCNSFDQIDSLEQQFSDEILHVQAELNEISNKDHSSHCRDALNDEDAALRTSATAGGEGKPVVDAVASPRARRKAFLAGRVSHMAPNFEVSDWTTTANNPCLTFVAMGEKSIDDDDDEEEEDEDYVEEEHPSYDVDDRVDDDDTEYGGESDGLDDFKDINCKEIDSTYMEGSISSMRHSSSLSQGEEGDGGQDIDVTNITLDSSCDGDGGGGGIDIVEDDSSSDDEIAFDDSSDDGSIQILESTLHLGDSSRSLISSESNGNTDKKNKKKKNKKRRRSSATLTLSPDCIQSVNIIRLICGKIINHPIVQGFIVFLIIMNAFQMGLSTFDFVDQNEEVQKTFDTVDMAFLIVFTVESAMQLMFHGLNLFRDGWLTFDFLIVVCSWAFSSLQVFRTLRTLRLIARVKILRRLCNALMEAVPRLTGILFLFILVMYIYAVMVTILFGDLYDRGLTEADYFSRLDITLFTLFQMITLDWANIVREVMVTYPLAYVVFTTYLTFTSFILFSLIIGVVCDAVSAIEHDATLLEQIQQKEEAQERILRLQHQVDYLKKQQKSVLASVQIVLDEIVESADHERNIYSSFNRGVNLRGSNRRSSRSLGSQSLSSGLRSSMGSRTMSSGMRSSLSSNSRRSSSSLIPPRENQKVEFASDGSQN